MNTVIFPGHQLLEHLIAHVFFPTGYSLHPGSWSSLPPLARGLQSNSGHRTHLTANSASVDRWTSESDIHLPAGHANAGFGGEPDGNRGFPRQRSRRRRAEVATALPSATASSETAVPTPTPASTATATSTPCFGSIVGEVLNDLNQNRQADSNEPGVTGATLYLNNSNGLIGFYTSGNGQFSFPGLIAGAYVLSETPPPGYAAEDSDSVGLTVTCGATATVNLFNAIAGATPVPTLTPTPRPASSAELPLRSNATGFAPFSTGPVSYVGQCRSINSPGEYYLTTSLSSHWDCIQIFSDNVIFDCQGNSLNGYDGNGYGVVVHHTSPILGRAVGNIEIRNCNMTRHRYGIFIDAADNLYIHGNNTSGNYKDTDQRNYGIFLGLVEGGGVRVNDTRGALAQR